jgi:hypothetical protein
VGEEGANQRRERECAAATRRLAVKGLVVASARDTLGYVAIARFGRPAMLTRVQPEPNLVAQEEAAASSLLEIPAWVIAIWEMAASMAGHSTPARTTAAPRGDRLEPSDRLASGGTQ